MRVPRVLIVLAVTFLVGAAGCSTSGGDDAEATTTSRVEAAPSSTTAASEPETTTAETTAEETTTTAGSESDTVACDLLDPADLTAAGIEGTISEEGDVSDNFSLGTAPSTACGYQVDQANSTIGLTVLVSDGVAADALDDATDFADDPQEVSGVGDRAIYDPGTDDDNEIYAQQGSRLVAIKSVDSTITPQATLEALARTLLAA